MEGKIKISTIYFMVDSRGLSGGKCGWSEVRRGEEDVSASEYF